MESVLDKVQNKLFGTDVQAASKAKHDEDRRTPSTKRNLSVGDVMDNVEVPGMFLGAGRETSKLSQIFIIDKGLVLNLLISTHDSSLGAIVPAAVVSGAPKVIPADDYIGLAFTFDNIDTTANPGTLVIADAGSGITRSIKAVDNKIRGVIFCAAAEQQIGYNFTDGVHAVASTDKFLIQNAADTITFTATGVSGEVYPIIPTRAFTERLSQFVADDQYSFEALCQEILEEIM